MDVLRKAGIVLHRHLYGNDLVCFKADRLLGQLLPNTVQILDKLDQTVLGIEDFAALYLNLLLFPAERRAIVPTTSICSAPSS